MEWNNKKDNHLARLPVVMKRMLILFTDAVLFASAAVLALLLRVGLEGFWTLAGGLQPYVIISFGAGTVVFFFLEVHKHFFSFFSLHEFRNVVIAVVLALLITAWVSFTFFLLEQVPRSLPIMQGLISLSGIAGFRLFGRWLGILHDRKQQQQDVDGITREGVLIIGLTPVAEIFLRSMALLGKNQLIAAGILDGNANHHGQHIRQCEVLGAPEELPRILDQLQLHGIVVRKVVLAISPDDLSDSFLEILHHLEAEGRIHVHNFHSVLAAALQLEHPNVKMRNGIPEKPNDSVPIPDGLEAAITQRLAKYEWLKRGADVFVALFMGLPALFVLTLAIPLVWLTMGRPVFFWQERPGRKNRIVRIYKLRTMKHGAGPDGRILTDEERQTALGRLLRSFRIDELPQLYNILKGDLSLIGPRPLLPVDLPEDMPGWIHLRRLARPGLTGWAQVHGGQALEKHLKVIMDVWYLVNVPPVP